MSMEMHVQRSLDGTGAEGLSMGLKGKIGESKVISTLTKKLCPSALSLSI
jgi:hypothetical protein